MKGKRIKQINNLIIRYTEIHQYAVWTPDGRCIEDRMTLEQAEGFCRDTKDFVKRENKIARCIKNCSECPFFECFLTEYEDGFGIVEKGKCHKWNMEELWGTKVPCNYAENKSIKELVEDSQ